jgi:hypothetical protein
MVYRFKVKGNPRAIGTLAMVFILLITAFTLLLRVQGSIGVGFGALSLLAAWFVFRIYRGHARSYVETTDDMFICHTAVNGHIRIPWAENSHLGMARSEKQRMLFVYQESQDQLLTIPEDFQNYQKLIEDLSSHRDFEELSLKGRQEIIDHLSKIVNDPKE